MFDVRFGTHRMARSGLKALSAIERLALGFADTVITVHDPYREELIARGADPKTTHVVMNSLDETVLPATLQPREKTWFRVVYHGTINDWYGVDLLVTACAMLAPKIENLRVEIYGEGDAVPALKELIAKHRLNCVELSEGYLDHSAALEAVAGADVGVIPNRPTRLNKYALSSKLFEYVALEVPVVSADLETLRYHFPTELAFFKPGDAHGLAAAIEAIWMDPEAARKRADEARERYTGTYAWAAQAERYVELLSRVSQPGPVRERPLGRDRRKKMTQPKSARAKAPTNKTSSVGAATLRPKPHSPEAPVSKPPGRRSARSR
jgi:glycosyltransferase involved in cell wall biosynthesis